jgi:hypothetical protein
MDFDSLPDDFVIAIDSTGLKLFNRGEWKSKKRRKKSKKRFDKTSHSHRHKDKAGIESGDQKACWTRLSRRRKAKVKGLVRWLHIRGMTFTAFTTF